MVMQLVCVSRRTSCSEGKRVGASNGAASQSPLPLPLPCHLPCLCLAGLASTQQSELWIVLEGSPDHRVLLPQSPGCGRSVAAGANKWQSSQLPKSDLTMPAPSLPIPQTPCSHCTQRHAVFLSVLNPWMCGSPAWRVHRRLSHCVLTSVTVFVLFSRLLDGHPIMSSL